MLIIFRKENIWILEENKINAPLCQERAEERENRIKSLGREDKMEIVFSLEHLKSLALLKSIPQFHDGAVSAYLCGDYILAKIKVSGLEDEFHSVFPSDGYTWLRELEAAFQKHCLNLRSLDAEPPADLAGARIALRGRISSLMRQRMTVFHPEYPELQYLDLAQGQIQLLLKKPISSKGEVLVIGRLAFSPGSQGQAGRKEIAPEAYLLVESFY